MKILKFIWLFTVLIIIETSIYASELKIGVVNATAVLERSLQKAQALLRLEKEFMSRDKALKKKYEDLRVAQEDMAKNGSILSANEMETMERRISNNKRELKRLQDEYGEDLSIRKNEEIRKLEKDIGETIINLAKSESYDLVVYQGFIYVSDRINITAKVLKLLNAKAELR